MLEAGAPVPYVQGQVGNEDQNPTTTLDIYDAGAQAPRPPPPRRGVRRTDGRRDCVGDVHHDAWQNRIAR
jgi:hypothetical protein